MQERQMAQSRHTECSAQGLRTSTVIKRMAGDDKITIDENHLEEKDR